MSEKSNWQLFVEDFKSLSDEDKHKVWNYIKSLKKCEEHYNKVSKKYLIHSEATQQFCMDVHNKFKADISSSVYIAVVNNATMSIDEVFEKYMANQSKKKPYIVGKEEEILELITHHYNNTEHEGIEAFPYLKPLNKDTQDFVIKIVKEHDLNLYHSVSSYYSNRVDLEPEVILEDYLKKYSSKRPYLSDNIDKLEELFKHTYKKLN